MSTMTRSKLQQTVAETATDYWNDSCSVEELTYAIEHGATGATSNPTIVHQVLRKEMHLWRDRIVAIAEERPSWTEREVTWQLYGEMGARGATLLEPVFEREGKLKGRLSIQTEPSLCRDPERLARQAGELAALAPNMQVKVPATRAGLVAIEDATARGVNVNATVCFTVPQALAVGAAVERGLERRQEQGGETSEMSPVCTIMVGRIDDWLKVAANRDGVALTPGAADWAGIACMKRAYELYRERGYRTRLLAAAYRSHLHWSQLVGGDVVLTIPYEWQLLINGSTIPVEERMSRPVPAEHLAELLERCPDFRRAYEPEGMAPEEFDDFGATRRTLRGFLASADALVAEVRDVLVPDPDVA